MKRFKETIRRSLLISALTVGSAVGVATVAPSPASAGGCYWTHVWVNSSSPYVTGWWGYGWVCFN
jgi:hypothetical protein